MRIYKPCCLEKFPQIPIKIQSSNLLPGLQFKGQLITWMRCGNSILFKVWPDLLKKKITGAFWEAELY